MINTADKCRFTHLLPSSSSSTSRLNACRNGLNEELDSNLTKYIGFIIILQCFSPPPLTFVDAGGSIAADNSAPWKDIEAGFGSLWSHKRMHGPALREGWSWYDLRWDGSTHHWTGNLIKVVPPWSVQSQQPIPTRAESTAGSHPLESSSAVLQIRNKHYPPSITISKKKGEPLPTRTLLIAPTTSL